MATPLYYGIYVRRGNFSSKLTNASGTLYVDDACDATLMKHHVDKIVRPYGEPTKFIAFSWPRTEVRIEEVVDRLGGAGAKIVRFEGAEGE